VAPEDPDALGAAVGSLLDDPDRARRLGAEGARHMEQAFSVSELIDEVEKVYRAVMDR
jgi:glycosyltransferase involved in cell wall biosynthesis